MSWDEGSGWMAVVVMVMAGPPRTVAGVASRQTAPMLTPGGDLACRPAARSLLADAAVMVARSAQCRCSARAEPAKVGGPGTRHPTPREASGRWGVEEDDGQPKGSRQ